jgi:hypothetical protein
VRADQLERLTALEESLIDVYLDEADPQNWPGVGTMGEHMSKEERGDRYWCKKNAVATVALAHETRKLIANDKSALGRDPYSDHELDKKIGAAEKRAREAIDRARHVATKNEFIKRATGGS